MTFHYRETPPHLVKGIVNRATEIFQKAGFVPHKAHKAIEARPPVRWDTGRACIYILRTMYGVDWSERVRIVFAGDDSSDEDAMKVLRGIACTFRVTSSPSVRTAANFRLANPDSVLTMMKWVERRLASREFVRTSPTRFTNNITVTLNNDDFLTMDKIHTQMSFSFDDSDEDNNGNKIIRSGSMSKSTRLITKALSKSCKDSHLKV